MASDNSIQPGGISDFPPQADQLVRMYVGDPLAPRADEVQRLTSALVEQMTELDRQNRELREQQRQLEDYRDRYVDLYDFAPSVTPLWMRKDISKKSI